MNRPKFNDYPHSDYTYEEKQDKYLKRLELYCDEIEHANENLCQQLADSSIICPKTNHLWNDKLCDNCTSKCYEEWKKWSMKEVEEDE